MASSRSFRVAGLALLVLGGLLTAGRFASVRAEEQVHQQIRTIWPDFESLPGSDKAVITRASGFCRLAEVRPAAQVQIANCLLVGAQQDDQEGQHGAENVSTFKRLYRATVMTYSRRTSLAQSTR